MEPKQKQYPVMDGTGDRSKVPCCKEHYCIGTWNVRSMNQGKLEVDKQEMAIHSSTLAWKIPGWRSLVGYSSWDHKEWDMTEQLH